jgi:anthranilate synthase component II
MLLLIDNYDSFVYNILHWLPADEKDIVICRNDGVTVSDLPADGTLAGVIISPGPMSPVEAGASNEVIRVLGARGVPILGICLGHQCIGHVFGCRVDRHPHPTHGKKSTIQLEPVPLFDGLGPRVEAGRYHSLHVSEEGFNQEDLEVTARLEDGTIMGLRHRRLPIHGVQFHPESVLTGEAGRRVLRNFVLLASSSSEN